jgi:hypothetical protein
MTEQMYFRAEDMVWEQPKPQPKPEPQPQKMVVKINHRPIRVEQDEDELVWYKRINWVYMGVSVSGYLLCLYIMDLAGYLFLGIHPFPFIKFVGVILSWFGIS